MKIIQSFWSQNQINPLESNYGWLSETHNWLSWILSANQLSKFYKVELYTDQKGYEILIEKLKLPYHKVHIVLDELNHYDKSLWAISKIKTYSLQNEPFLHIDGDVFIWKEFSNELMNGNLITQNLEATTEYYEEMWNDIYPNLKYVPKEMESYLKNSANYAYNMGIIGGNNYTYFKHYAKTAFEFVDKNKSVWNKINGFNFNIFFEQVLFFNMINNPLKEVRTLFSDMPNDNNYIGFGDFDKVPKEKNYLHLLGTYKKSERVCNNLETYVIKEYPEYFERLRELFPLQFSSYEKSFDADKNQKIKDDYREHVLIKRTDKLSNNYITGRNFMALEFPQEFDKLITNNQDFELEKLSEVQFEDYYDNELNENIRLILIPELNQKISQLIIDEIDDLILQELEKPALYTTFLERMNNYLEDDMSIEESEKFNKLLQKRIRFFLVEKTVFLNPLKKEMYAI
jgi:hypothetical protein